LNYNSQIQKGFDGNEQLALTGMAFTAPNGQARDQADEDESILSQAFYPPVCCAHQPFSVEEEDTTLQERAIADNIRQLI